MTLIYVVYYVVAAGSAVVFAGASFSIAVFAVVVLGSAFFVVVLVAIIASLQGEIKCNYATRILRFPFFCNNLFN